MVGLDSEENTPIISSEGDDLDHQEEDPEETQVEETKYGWMVVAASFLCNLVIDGNVIICFVKMIIQYLENGSGYRH